MKNDLKKYGESVCFDRTYNLMKILLNLKRAYSLEIFSGANKKIDSKYFQSALLSNKKLKILSSCLKDSLS